MLFSIVMYAATSILLSEPEFFIVQKSSTLLSLQQWQANRL
jgi:hypothetical protein